MEYYFSYDVDPSKLVNIEYLKGLNKNTGMVLANSDQALVEKFRDYLKPFGLKKNLMLFFRKAHNCNQVIHTDFETDDKPWYYSFNVTLQGQGRMVWYKEVDGGVMFRHQNDPKHILYKKYFNIKLEEADSWSTKKVALVRTGVPHGVENPDDEERICLSIRIDDYGWDKAKDIFNTYISSL